MTFETSHGGLDDRVVVTQKHRSHPWIDESWDIDRVYEFANHSTGETVTVPGNQYGVIYLPKDEAPPWAWTAAATFSAREEPHDTSDCWMCSEDGIDEMYEYNRQ